MWFDNKIFEADTTEDQSGTAMENVRYITFLTAFSILHCLHKLLTLKINGLGAIY